MTSSILGFVVGISIALAAIFYTEHRERDCQARGGVLATQYFGDVCIKAEVIK